MKRVSGLWKSVASKGELVGGSEPRGRDKVVDIEKLAGGCGVWGQAPRFSVKSL